MDMAIEYRDRGVVGVDIAGDELQPMAPHIDAFKVTMHNMYLLLLCRSVISEGKGLIIRLIMIV